MNENLLFYDIEVFKYDSLVVFKNIKNEEEGSFWTAGDDGYTPTQQSEIAKLIEGRTLVGYNNHFYDDYILTTMLRSKVKTTGASCQAIIKATNDMIINGNLPSFKLEGSIAKSLDCMQQIDVSVPSLKKIEGNLGKSVLESEIPFDYPEPLTDEQKNIVHKYCSYDVENTIEVFKLREKNYFQTREELLKMLPDGDSKVRLNTTTLSALILLGGNPLDKWTTIRFKEMLSGVPSEVLDMWIKASNMMRDKTYKSKPITLDKYGCSITFGSGGLHGVAKGQKEFRNVKLLDVGSMYPTIITILQALGIKGTEVYDNLRQERLRIKHSDPVKAGALKLILNSVYGNLKNEYSDLNNPQAALTVCIYGQAALYDLCGMLYEKGYQVMNINTDGVGFTDNEALGDTPWMECQKEWEDKWKLYLELDEFDLWIQKDVNNYIAKQGEHIKVKGGDLNKYQESKPFSNNNARIIHIAVAESLVNGTPIMNTIVKHLDKPELYQYILNAGSTYLGTCDESGNILPQKVNRVFPVHEGTEGERKLYKLRPDFGKVLFPDMSEHLLLWNDDVSEYRNFRHDIDIDFYANLASKKLEAWRN